MELQGTGMERKGTSHRALACLVLLASGCSGGSSTPGGSHAPAPPESGGGGGPEDESARSPAGPAATCRVASPSRATVYTYEGGRLVRALTEDSGGPNRETVLAYIGDRLVSLRQDPGAEVGGEMVVDYRDDGRVESVASYMAFGAQRGPEQYRLLYRYDGSGRLSVREMATGGAVANRVTFAYDAEGRIATLTTTLVPPDDGEPANVTTLTYDTAGRLASMVRGMETLTYAYDSAGRLATITSTWSYGEVRVTTLTRDDEGRVIRRQDAGGGEAEFVERIEYEGDFPPGFECDGLPATPEGLPEPRILAWLNATI